jgi:3-phenylpropionate/cinnamic acid dioxygenase small subunit
MAPSTPEEGIRRTLAHYGLLLDDGRFDEWSQLFVEDARFHVMGATQVGRADITAWIMKNQGPELRGKHAVLAPLIDLDGDRARVWTDYLFVDQQQTVLSVGRYHDEVVRGDDGRWRFALREIVFMGGAPEVTAAVPG